MNDRSEYFDFLTKFDAFGAGRSWIISWIIHDQKLNQIAKSDQISLSQSQSGTERLHQKKTRQAICLACFLLNRYHSYLKSGVWVWELERRPKVIDNPGIGNVSWRPDTLTSWLWWWLEKSCKLIQCNNLREYRIKGSSPCAPRARVSSWKFNLTWISLDRSRIGGPGTCLQAF